MSLPLPDDDDFELIEAAMAYLSLAMMQQVRPDAHLVVDRHAPMWQLSAWPAGWTWEPESTARENMLKARNLIDTQLAEPDQMPAPAHGYPLQSEVSAVYSADPSMNERTLDLLREVGALRTALLVRQEHGNFAEWTARIRVAFGDVFLHLLDLAEAAGFDLETTASLRWKEVTADASPQPAP